MKKSIRKKPGDLVLIPYCEGFHTYARILIEGSYAFYDASSKTERTDYSEIIKSDILFVATVDIFGLKEGYWKIVTNIPLEENLKNFYPRYFNPDPSNFTNLNFYEVYQTEIDNAIEKYWIRTGKNKLAGMHARVHIESRLRDYYNHKRNEIVASGINSFKNVFERTRGSV